MTDKIILVYDKECPLCDAYCRMARIRASAGQLELVDARTSPNLPNEMLDEITARGLDIDQGMVLKLGGKLYYGSDAIHTLALLSTRNGLFNRINYWIFCSPRVSHMLYPVFRFFRNLLLKLLRKTKINNLNIRENSRF